MRKKLWRLIQRHHSSYAIVVRAKIVLMAWEGLGTEEIARRLSISDRTVRKWKARFTEDPHPDTLLDRERSGRPPTIPLEVRCQLVQLACDRPEGEDSPAPFRDVWTYGALRDALEEISKHRISVSEVGRILRFEKLRPHRVRQWLKCTDPDFLAKAKKVCRLYLRPPKDGVVVCVDEKPMQTHGRIHPTHTDLRDGSVRYEYEYKRHGTQVLLAAFETQTGEVFGQVVPNRTADALMSFMDALAGRYPGKRIYVVWDNLNIHYDGKDERLKKLNARHGKRFRFVYTPRHASWMNQIEIWFSILHRRVLKYGDFCSLADQAARVEGYIGHWNRRECHPFRWTWRTEKLHNEQRLAA